MQAVLLQVTFNMVRRQLLGVIHHFQYRLRRRAFQPYVEDGRDKITVQVIGPDKSFFGLVVVVVAAALACDRGGFRGPTVVVMVGAGAAFSPAAAAAAAGV
jgi:hypothetical protein